MEGQTKTIIDRLSFTKSRKRSGEDMDYDASTFKVKALRLDGVPVESLELDASNEAVDAALGSIGSLLSKNKHDTILKISPKTGVEIISKKSKKSICNYRIHEVGYCNVDKRYPEIFVFMGAKVKSDVRCRVFLCDDQAKARAICLTMAKCFQTTFTNWQKQKELDGMCTGNSSNRRQTVGVPRRGVEDYKAEMRARRNQRSSSVDGYDDNIFGQDIEMDKTFEKIMEKSTHRGKYSLLGSTGSDNWESFDE